MIAQPRPAQPLGFALRFIFQIEEVEVAGEELVRARVEFGVGRGRAKAA